MGITNQFERNLFFVFGRHIWNIVGVSGFVSVLAGGVLYFESFSTINLKSKEQYFGRPPATLQSKKIFFGKDYLSDKEILNKGISSGKILTFDKFIESRKNNKERWTGLPNMAWCPLRKLLGILVWIWRKLINSE